MPLFGLESLIPITDLAKAIWSRVTSFLFGPPLHRAARAAYRRAVNNALSTMPSSMAKDLRKGFYRSSVQDELTAFLETSERQPDLDLIRAEFSDAGLGGLTLSLEELIADVQRSLRQELKGELETQVFATGRQVEQSAHDIREIKEQVGQLARSGTMGAVARSEIEAADQRVQLLIESSLVNELSGLSGIISDETEAQLQRMRAAWREGKRTEVIAWLDEFHRNQPRQSAVAPTVAAKILRFHAGVILEQGKPVDRAKALLENARSLEPDPDDVVLQALIALRESGPEEALRCLANPKSQRQRNLRAGILLESGRPDEALKLLLPDGEDAPRNAETYRLRALAFLMRGNLSEARTEIGESLRIDPRPLHTRRLAAELEYFSGLSEAVVPSRPPGWPQPVNPDFVRTDYDGQTHFANAVREFTRLLDLEDVDERQQLEAWRLASLSNISDHFREAEEYCRTLLASDPTHPLAIIWAVVRGFEVDSQRSIEALEERLSDSPDVEHGIALCALRTAAKHPEATQRVLDSTRTLFHQVGADSAWRYWRIQSLIQQRRYDDALRLVNDSPPEEAEAERTMIYQARAAEDEDLTPLRNHLDSLYAETRNPVHLLEVCQIRARQGDWTWIAERAQTLVETVATSPAVWLAAAGLYNTGRFSDCLRILDEQLHSEPTGSRSLNLRRLRAMARDAIGSVAAAIGDLKAVADANPSTENLVLLAQLYLHKGDLKQVALIARDLRERDDLPVGSALGLAEVLSREDRPLAIDLWRRTLKQDLPDDAVAQVYMAGIHLGLDEETRSLTDRMSILAREGRGGIQMFSLDDLRAHGSRWNTDQEQLVDSYRRGDSPLHALSARLKEPLVRFCHVIPGLNESAPNPLIQFALRARHGGRPLLQFDEIVPEWRISMDVGALILAHHLDILPAIEQRYTPIRLPHDTSRLLLQMQEQLLHHQPSRLATFETLLESMRLGRFQVRTQSLPELEGLPPEVVSAQAKKLQLLLLARKKGGYVVDFGEEELLSALGKPATSLAEYLVTPRAVVQSLLDFGPLMQLEYEQALDRLGIEANESGPLVVPDQSRPLYCSDGTLELLASAGVLDTVCDRFTVFVEPEAREQWAATLAWEARASRDVQWLADLVRRVSEGLESGTYALLPRSIDTDGSYDTDKLPLELGALMEILRIEGDDHDVIWVDDRFVNRHSIGKGARIVDTIDMLTALRAAGDLGESDYFEKIRRLRAANVRFIPITSEEIVHHLRNAPVRDGEVIETRGLAALRRYAAACLLDTKSLQVPTIGVGVPLELGELPFLLSLNNQVPLAIVELWKPDLNGYSEARAQAEWILSNLYLDLGLARTAVVDPAKPPEASVAAVGLAALISHALVLLGRLVDSDSRTAEKYVQWVYERIIARRLEADPELIAPVTEILKSHILATRERFDGEMAELVAQVFAGTLYDILPGPIQEQMRDPVFLERIGRGVVQTFQDRGLVFPADEFLRAGSAALKGERVTIRTVGDDTVDVIFEPSVPPALFQYRHPETGDTRVVQDVEFGLLTDSLEERRAVLSSLRTSFDVPDAVFASEAEKIVNHGDPVDRIQRTRALRDENLAEFYDRLYQQLRTKLRFAYRELLPPSGRAVLWHLRLPSASPSIPFPVVWAQVSSAMVAELPIEHVLNRVLGLPIPVPEEVLHQLDQLDSITLRQVIKRRLRLAKSPVSAVNYLRVLTYLGARDPTYSRLARRVAAGLACPEQYVVAQSFGILLRWIEQNIRSWEGARDWDSTVLLAVIWYHADRIFAAFRAAGADLTRLGELFKDSVHVSPGLFERSSSYWHDIAHPRHFRPVRFILSGIAYALGDAATKVTTDLLRKRLRDSALNDYSGSVAPVLELFEDTTLIENNLGTFLRIDPIALHELLGEDTASKLDTIILRHEVEQAIASLEIDSSQLSGWGVLLTILNDHRIYGELADRLSAVVARADFAEVFRQNPESGQIAIRVAADHVAHFGDSDARAVLKQALRQIAEAVATNKQDSAVAAEDENRPEWTLIEAASVLAIAEGGPSEAITDFADQLNALIESNPALAPMCRAAVQTLWEELPLRLAEKFTRPLLRLRAIA